MLAQLADAPATAPTHALLRVMLTGGLEAFRAGDWAAVLQQAGVSQDDCLDKVRSG